MKVCLIVQARMGSERLPGKVLKEVLGKPLLGYQCERLERVKLKDKLVVATTTHASDDAVVEFCQARHLVYFRGSEQDVLERYYEVATREGAEAIVRLTADCPLIDPEIVDRVIEFYLKNLSKFDYVSNVLERTYPRGMDCEVFGYPVLVEAHHQAQLAAEREHVTSFIYTRPERYRLGSVTSIGKNESRHRWTVDTPEDFELIRKILTELYPKNQAFSTQDVLELLARNPDWENLNAHIQQKETDS